jgi:hypothetical protein
VTGGTEAAVARERGILFSAAMVRALLEGRKTQTRRIITPQPIDHDFGPGGVVPALTGKHVRGFIAIGASVANGMIGALNCPYGKRGDRLWVRETYSHGPVFNADQDYSTRLRFRANEHDSPLPSGQKWRPSIFMPRWASRITLEVTEVRVQRLHEISEDDALAEGVSWEPGEQEQNVRKWAEKQTARMRFADLWDGINGDRADWDANPWVWAITFRVIA